MSKYVLPKLYATFKSRCAIFHPISQDITSNSPRSDIYHSNYKQQRLVFCNCLTSHYFFKRSYFVK